MVPWAGCPLGFFFSFWFHGPGVGKVGLTDPSPTHTSFPLFLGFSQISPLCFFSLLLTIEPPLLSSHTSHSHRHFSKIKLASNSARHHCRYVFHKSKCEELGLANFVGKMRKINCIIIKLLI